MPVFLEDFNNGGEVVSNVLSNNADEGRQLIEVGFESGGRG